MGHPQNTTDQQPVQPADDPRDSIVAWAIPLVFVILAACFLAFGGGKPDIPVGDMVEVSPSEFAAEPMRSPTLIAATESGGFEMNCNACHRMFESAIETPSRLTQHTNITFDHGMNNRCFNCHDRENREQLALYSGEKIGFDQSVRLCAQCHGPTFRDWERGVHGKTFGHWNAEMGESIRLNCNQCHDPHAPAFAPMHPLPGPHTLRMGDTHDVGGEH